MGAIGTHHLRLSYGNAIECIPGFHLRQTAVIGPPAGQRGEEKLAVRRENRFERSRGNAGIRSRIGPRPTLVGPQRRFEAAVRIHG